MHPSANTKKRLRLITTLNAKKFYIKREKTHTTKHRIDKTPPFHSPKLSKNVVPLFTTIYNS